MGIFDIDGKNGLENMMMGYALTKIAEREISRAEDCVDYTRCCEDRDTCDACDTCDYRVDCCECMDCILYPEGCSDCDEFWDRNCEECMCAECCE